ncbi:MAG: 4Fe-4S binding protein [Anaerovorax sp.]
MAKYMVKFDIEKCKGCELCISACPTKIIKLHENELNSKGYRPTYIEEMEKCIGCTSCAIMCPDGVISVYQE